MDLKTLIQEALKEDVGSGDITTDCLVDPHLVMGAKIEAKQDLVLAGLDIAHKIFLVLDDNCHWKSPKKDGMSISKNETVATLRGKAASILKAERVALNFLQHLSGIATLTRQFVDAVRDTPVKILDTRKTLPGWRSLEKYAVCMGGGNSHRLGLFDRYLIKNNHIDIAGSISEAISAVLKQRQSNLLIEVEVRNLDELKTALDFPIDIILLDNFTPAQVKEGLELGRGKVQFEVSGGIHLSNIREYAATGIHFISSGSLTHSAPAADLHLIFD